MQRLLTFQGVRLALLAGIAVALVVGGAWIALTAATGKTYHLAPLLGAVGPGLTVRSLLGTRLGWMSGLALGGAGAALMIGCWGIILALDIEPTTTIADGIPGDVLGEVIIGAAAGAVISAFLHARGSPRAS